MALTYSTMLPLGTQLPEFSLRDVQSNIMVSSKSLPKAPGYLVMVICNHCPYVIHVRTVLTAFAVRAQAQGIQVLAVSANDAAAYPDDGPEQMKEIAENKGFTFPYLFDEKQELVKKLKAVCTPEFYFFDSSRKLIYRGQMDDSRPGQTQQPNNAYCLEAALQAVLTSRPLTIEQKASMGCNIKWKKGTTPEYSAQK
jgi:peroxiredoxin